MLVKGEVLVQLFNKSKVRNGTKTFLEPKFFSIVKFKKLGFSASLIEATAQCAYNLNSAVLSQKSAKIL